MLDLFRYAAALGITLLLCFYSQPSFEVLRLQYTLAPRLVGPWISQVSAERDTVSDLAVGSELGRTCRQAVSQVGVGLLLYRVYHGEGPEGKQWVTLFRRHVDDL